MANTRDRPTGGSAALDRVADRLREAGLSTMRFIDVHDGAKRSTDHTRHGPGRVRGNYGVYAGDGLVDVDVDDYNDAVDDAALEAVLDLPQTLTVESPHTDGVTGGHYFFAVVAGEEFETAAEACEAVTGTTNPAPSWGEVRVRNQYVVGPGSHLDGCEKQGCDACASPDGGRYEIAADRPIATITADDLADVLLADPQYQASTRVDEYEPTNATPDARDAHDSDQPTRTQAKPDGTPEGNVEHPDPGAVVAATGVAEHYPKDGDRSECPSDEMEETGDS